MTWFVMVSWDRTKVVSVASLKFLIGGQSTQVSLQAENPATLNKKGEVDL